MKRLFMLLVVAGLVGACLSAGAQAQQPPRPGTTGARPPVSPYLNLTRGGSPALNYYNLVRPQIDTARDLNQLQSEIDLIHQQSLLTQQQQLNRVGAEQNITGHPVRFYSLSPYFNYNPTRVTYPKQQR